MPHFRELFTDLFGGDQYLLDLHTPVPSIVKSIDAPPCNTARAQPATRTPASQAIFPSRVTTGQAGRNRAGIPPSRIASRTVLLPETSSMRSPSSAALIRPLPANAAALTRTRLRRSEMGRGRRWQTMHSAPRPEADAIPRGKTHRVQGYEASYVEHDVGIFARRKEATREILPSYLSPSYPQDGRHVCCTSRIGGMYAAESSASGAATLPPAATSTGPRPER